MRQHSPRNSTTCRCWRAECNSSSKSCECMFNNRLPHRCRNAWHRTTAGLLLVRRPLSRITLLLLLSRSLSNNMTRLRHTGSRMLSTNFPPYVSTNKKFAASVDLGRGMVFTPYRQYWCIIVPHTRILDSSTKLDEFISRELSRTQAHPQSAMFHV